MMPRLMLFALLLTACGDLPDPAPAGSTHKPTDHNPGGQDPGGDDPGGDDPGGGGDQPSDPPAVPIVSDTPDHYGYSTLPVRGQTAPYLSVFVEGGQAPVATEADLSGSFCVDVPLKLEAKQTLEVYAQNAQGETSSPKTFEVTQDSSLQETEQPEADVEDLADGLPFFSDATPAAGQLTDLGDNDGSTGATMPESYVWVDLGAAYDLNLIRLFFPGTAQQGSDTYATEYMVLASASDSPSLPPSYDSADWELLYDIYPDSGSPAGIGDGGEEKFILNPTFSARWVALYLIEDNNIDAWWDDEDIEIADFQAIGEHPGAPTPVPLTPTCANGESAE